MKNELLISPSDFISKMVKMYYRLKNVEKWRECMDHLTITHFCEDFCSEMLLKVYRIIFFLNDIEYKQDQKLYQTVRLEIEKQAQIRKFDFFYDQVNKKKIAIADVELVASDQQQPYFI